MKSRILFLIGAVPLLCFGCKRDVEQIKVYRLVKAPLESSPSETKPSALADGNSLPPAPSEISGQAMPATALPANWESQPPSQMRQASFLVRGDKGATADISLVVLGVAAGNVLDNVNRWLSQLGQPPISAELLTGLVQHLPTAKGDVAVVDLAGTPENGDASKDGRIVAAMMTDQGKTSFFKMRGNAALAEKEKDNFLRWVSAVCSGGAATQTAGADAPPSAAESHRIKWALPKGWTVAPASAMRYASFTAAGENGGPADISIVTFPGDGGNDLDNVNRWRQQIGLSPADPGQLDSLITPLKAGDDTYSTVDMAGAQSCLIAGWTRRDSRTWFFKMTGSKEAVQREKPKFVKFLQSVRF